jgi:hypothetical protein
MLDTITRKTKTNGHIPAERTIPITTIKTSVVAGGFTIETVPLPLKRNSARGSTPIYPFAELRAGQSFLVPLGKRSATTLQSTLLNCIANYKKTTGAKSQFTTRREAGGVRVFRTK